MLASAVTLTERINTQLIADGYPVQCVTWVCDQHHRHCTHLGTDHTKHECIWCDDPPNPKWQQQKDALFVARHGSYVGNGRG